MLETAFQCFQGASRCEGDSDEEEWLIHYMLAKIAEKRQKPPVDYLQLYTEVKTHSLSFFLIQAAAGQGLLMPAPTYCDVRTV